MKRERLLGTAFWAAMCAVAAFGDSFSLAWAQPPGLPPERRKYTPVDAAFDSFYLSDAQRLAGIDQQLGLNNRMRMTSWIGSYYRGVFEPWPMVPGGIWGYPILNPLRQSVGQRSYQAAPNRWISEPVYADQLPPAAPPVAPLGFDPRARVLAPPGEVALPAPRPELGPGLPGAMAPGAAAPSGPAIPPAAGPREF